MTLNKKSVIIVLSCILIVTIVLFIFPDIFAFRKSQYLGSGDAEISQIKSQSKDTSLDSIKKDLDDTDLTEVDRELKSIENEMGSSI